MERASGLRSLRLLPIRLTIDSQLTHSVVTVHAMDIERKYTSNPSKTVGIFYFSRL
jgi:hypothetical protein